MASRCGEFFRSIKKRAAVLLRFEAFARRNNSRRSNNRQPGFSPHRPNAAGDLAASRCEPFPPYRPSNRFGGTGPSGNGIADPPRLHATARSGSLPARNELEVFHRHLLEQRLVLTLVIRTQY